MTALWDYSVIEEVTIARPASSVWPYLFGDRKALWAKTQYTALRGEAGRLGEAFFNEYGEGRLVYETIGLKKHQRLVLKITHADGNGSGEQLVGYDFITLKETAGRTTLAIVQAFSLPVETASEDLPRESGKQDAMLRGILSNLKSLIEESDSAQ